MKMSEIVMTFPPFLGPVSEERIFPPLIVSYGVAGLSGASAGLVALSSAS